MGNNLCVLRLGLVWPEVGSRLGPKSASGTSFRGDWHSPWFTHLAARFLCSGKHPERGDL